MSKIVIMKPLPKIKNITIQEIWLKESLFVRYKTDGGSLTKSFPPGSYVEGANILFNKDTGEMIRLLRQLNNFNGKRETTKYEIERCAGSVYNAKSYKAGTEFMLMGLHTQGFQ